MSKKFAHSSPTNEHPQRRAEIQQARDHERETGESVGLNLIRGERRRDKNRGAGVGPSGAGPGDGGAKESATSAAATQAAVPVPLPAAVAQTKPPALWFMGGGGGATDSAPKRVVDMKSMTADGLLAMASA